MSKKEIQEQRMRGYFIQATKEILRGEGLRGISVRNIADRAGYSYATLYNYFRDVKDLIFFCVRDFQDECERFVFEETKQSPRGTGKIKAIVKSFVRYYIQYPGIFELFYLERMSDIGNRQPTIKLIYTFLDRLCADEWAFCVDHGKISARDRHILSDQVRYVVTGMLLFYINRNIPSDFKKFDISIDRQLDVMIDGNISPYSDYLVPGTET
jgi:AcrR family transcriptional regulator